MKKNLVKILFAVLALALAFAAFTVISSADAGVAKIGDTSYASLNEALNAAQNGDTVVLTNDATLTAIYAIQGTAEERKTVTVDLNGKSITNNAGKFFQVNAYGTLKVVGSGSLKVGGAVALFVAQADASAEVIIGTKGSTTEKITMDDLLCYESGGDYSLVQVRKGSLQINNVEMDHYHVKDGMYAIDCNTNTGAIEMNNCRLACYGKKVGYINFGNGGAINFRAYNTRFEMPDRPDDNFEQLNPSTSNYNQETNKCNGFNFNALTNPSTLYFENCFFEYRWRGLVNNTSSAPDVSVFQAYFKNSVIRPGRGNLWHGDGNLVRQLGYTLEDCMIDDTHFHAGQKGTGNATFSWGPVNYVGVIQSKYGHYAPSGLKGYFCKTDTTGYPFYYAAEVPEGAISSDNYVVRISENFENWGYYANSQDWQVETNSTRSWAWFNIAVVSKSASAAPNYKFASFETTTGTERYLRFFFLADQNTLKYSDSSVEFKFGGNASTYNFANYRYYTLDYDFMTDTAFPTELTSAIIARNATTTGGPRLGNNELFGIFSDEKGAYLKLRSINNNKDERHYLESNRWYHVTVVFDVAAVNDSGVMTSNRVSFYLDGQRLIDTVYTGVTTSDASWLDGIRIQNNYGTTANVNDAICIDNVLAVMYKRASAVDPLDDLLKSDKSVTLQQYGYMGWDGECSEFSAVATVAGRPFPTLSEAYAFAKANNVGALTLVSDTDEKCDITSEIIVYTNGIDWVPTDASWGFERKGEGTGSYYEFSSKLNRGATTYWFSNPFDSEFAFEYSVRGGRRIAHPEGDTNFAYLQNYGLKNADGSYSFYRFIGWSNTEGSTVADATFPIITSGNIDSDTLLYYPVYEAYQPLYGYEISAPLQYMNEDWEIYTQNTTIYAAGSVLNDLRNYVQKTEDKKVVLCDDITVNESLGALFVVFGKLDFDLNGHTVSYVIYSAATASNSVSKQNIFDIKDNATLSVVSSQPGAVIEGRTIAYNMTGDAIVNNATGVFSLRNNTNLTVTGSNVTIRCGIVEEASNNNITVLFDGCNIHQVCADSWGCFMIRSTGVVSFTLRDVLFVNTVKTTGGNLLQKELFDVGQGSAVQKVDIKIENCRFYWSQNTGDSGAWLTARFPAGATLEISGTVGNYCPGTSQTGKSYAGVIKVGANNSFARAIDSSANYAQTQFEDGVVCARKWAFFDVTDRFADGLTVSYIHEPGVNSSTPKAYEDYATQWTVGYMSNVKFRWGSFKTEDVHLVVWNETTDVNSKVYSTCLWYKTEKNPYYANAVPSYTDASGFTYSYPNDSWKQYAASEDGLTVYYAPDPAKAMLSGANISGFKQNVILSSEMAMNLFVPVTTATATVSANGVVLPATERVVDGENYIAFRAAVDATHAADEIEFIITYALNGTQVQQTVRTSVAGYAEALATYEAGAYADLALAMLRYAKAAFLYAAEEGAVLPEALNIADAETHAAMPSAVYTVDEDQNDVLGAYVALGASPVYVMQVSNEFSGTIEVHYVAMSGREYNLTREVEAGETLLTFDIMKLYDFDATFTIYVNGENIGQYNFGAYAGSVTDAKALAVLVALNDYIVAAREYVYGN